MSSLPSIIDEHQMKQILADFAEKTKKLFATKSELNAQIANLTDDINVLKGRVEELESKNNNSENLDDPVDDNF